MRNILVEITCRNCFYHTHIKSHTMVLAELEPKLRERILAASMFSYRCPRCGSEIEFLHNFLYRDKAHEFLIYMSEDKKDVSELLEQFPHWTLRTVHSTNDLQEKIRILEDGLDDRWIELLKVKLFQQEEQVRYFDQDEHQNLWFTCSNAKNNELKGITNTDYLRFQERYQYSIKQNDTFTINQDWAIQFESKGKDEMPYE